MAGFLSALAGKPPACDVEFWHGAERSGWLMKQGRGERREREGGEGGRGAPTLMWRPFFRRRAHLSFLRRVHQDVAPPVSGDRGRPRRENGRHGTGRHAPPRNRPHPAPPPFLPRPSWFVLKEGKIFWFKTDALTPASTPRGVIDVHRCLSVKGAEDALGRPHAFELSTADDAMFFIADSDREKEDWINAVGRAIVRHSRSLLEEDRGDYSVGAGGGGGGG